jgi:cytochrome c peroxidase
MRRPPVILFAVLAIAACSTDATPTKKPAPDLGLPAMTRPAGYSAAKAELGKKLFFDTRLSSNGSMSCSSCHQHELGWTDGKSLSPKVDGSINTRHSPSLYNVGYQPHFYWDGRAATLEGNVEAAWKGHMGGDPAAMAQKLAGIDAYGKEFQSAFGAAPSGPFMVEALASFVRSLVSGGSRFDQFQAGDTKALTADEQEGWKLFQQACVACHAAPLFTDHLFHNVGIGMTAANVDIGRKKIDDKAAIGSFKTPSLRSISKSAPYFHDGSVATLEEAVRLMAKGGLENEHLDPILGAVKARNYTDAEIGKLVAFLRSLDSVEDFVAPTLPN